MTWKIIELCQLPPNLQFGGSSRSQKVIRKC